MKSSTLKVGIGLLVLANCGLWAYNAGYLGADSTAGREPARVADQRNAQSIRLIAPPRQPTAAPGADNPESVGGAPVPTVPLAPPPSSEQAAAAAMGVSATSAAPNAAPLQCIEIGNFDVAEARRFDQQIAALAPGARLARRGVQEIERWIVYIPPLADKESAERKAAELRRLGVDDFYVFNDNSALRWGISLGVFKTAEAARAQMANLAQKGVRSAKVSPRPAAVSKTAYQLRDIDAAVLATIRQAFPRQENRVCPAA